MVGVSDMVNRMQGNFGADRNSYMTSLMRPELLILDDLGAERNTSFGKERVFDVINRRRLTGKPMIITPIRFDGENFRRGNAKHNLEKRRSFCGIKQFWQRRTTWKIKSAPSPSTSK